LGERDRMKKVARCCSRPHKSPSFVNQIYMQTTTGEVLAKQWCQNKYLVSRKQACAGVLANLSTTKAGVPDARRPACVLGFAMHHESFYTSHQQMCQMQEELHIYRELLCIMATCEPHHTSVVGQSPTLRSRCPLTHCTLL